MYKCIVLFDNDIAMISNILKVIYKTNPNLIIIKTKVDQYNKHNIRTIIEEKELDTKKVRELLNCTELKTYCVSSHNIMNNVINGRFDWNTIKIEIGL